MVCACAAQQLLGWRVFPLPLYNTDKLALPTVPQRPAAAPAAAPAQAPLSATASLGAPMAAPEAGAAASYRSDMSRATRMGACPCPFRQTFCSGHAR